MSNYFNSIEHQINLMLDREQDLQDEQEQRLRDIHDGIGDYVLLPEGDPWNIDDYEQDPRPTNVNNTCSHGRLRGHRKNGQGRQDAHPAH
mgnify:CR=1 FL=1